MATSMANEFRHRRIESVVRKFACATLLIAVAGAAGAQQQDDTFSASVYAGYDHSENALQQRTGGDAEIGRVGLDASLVGGRRRMEYSLEGDVSWADYSDNARASTLEGGLDGLLNFGAADDLLQWTVQDSIRQSLLDPAGNLTVDNSEYVNSFSTGPTIALRIGERTGVILSGLYSRLSYENSPLDTNSVAGTAGISRSLPGGGSLGLYVSAAGISQVSDDLAVSGYDLHQAYLQYISGELDRTTISLDAGYVESRRAGTTSGGALARVSVQSRLSTGAVVFFDANRTVTNAAKVRSIGASGQPAHESPVSAVGAVKSTGIDAGWSTSGRRNTLNLTGGWRKEDYQWASQFDREVAYFGSTLSRRVRSTLTATLSAIYNSQEFADPALPEYDYQTVSLSLDQRFGRRVIGGLSINYAHRNDKVTSQFEFVEWRYGLSISYLLTDKAR